MSNPFDQFDQPSAGGNPFDRYDSAPAPKAAAKPSPVAKKPREWSDVPGEALSNLLPSAGNLVSGIAQAVMNPIDTATNVLDVGAGAVRNALPERLVQAIDRLDGGSARGQQMSQKASATGQFFKDRYGSMEGVKNTLATDPVGALADASTVLTGGAALAGKVGLSGTGAALRTAGNAINPVGIAAKGGAKLARGLGNGAANVIGGLGTHTGAETIKQAFRSGREGGQSAKAFTDNMRGNVPITDVLDDAKANIEAMGRAKSEAYRADMANVRGDRTVLAFDGIDGAVTDAFKSATFKGQVKNTKAAQVQQQIAEEVANWKSLDPAEFHTPEGLDALKQKIGGIVEGIPFEEKTARMVGNKVYNSIKTEIVKQAPTYAKTMKAYSEATEQIREIERALSLGGKASVDTAMRKLQSLTRNNVNTNYGNRLRLAQEMEQQGGRAIMPALSGQALSSWTPRGLGGVAAGGLGLGGYAVGGAPLAAGSLALQSPRLMGEAAFATGQAARLGAAPVRAAGGLLDNLGIDPLDLPNALYQAGNLPQQ